MSPSLRAQRGCAGSALCLSPLSSFSPSLSLLPAGPRHPGPQPGTVPLSSAALCPRCPPAVFCVPLGRHLRPRLVLECKASPTTEGSGRHPAFLHVPACGTIPSSAPACSAASWSLCPPSSVCPQHRCGQALAPYLGALGWLCCAIRLCLLPPCSQQGSVPLLTLAPHLLALIGTSRRCSLSPCRPQPCCGSGLSLGLVLLADSSDVPKVPAWPFPHLWDGHQCAVSCVPAACRVPAARRVLWHTMCPCIPAWGCSLGTGVIVMNAP